MLWIGIDFGTTNSASAMIEQQRFAETLGGPTGDLPIPSMISYFQDAYRYGFDALKASLTDGDNSLIITGLKPQLGRAPELRIGPKTFHTEELVTRFLKSLIEQLFGGRPAPDMLGAVIATPVEFPPAHRQALLRAARGAGISQVEFVYEPTAAVYSAIQHGDFPEGPVGVIDWGGGTVDITIVRCARSPNRIEDLNVNARSSGLGGRDLDLRILSKALSRCPDAQSWFDSANRSIQSSILSRLERGKIAYLSTGSLANNTDFWQQDTPPELYPYFKLTGPMIEECLDWFVDKVRRLAIETTRSANLAIEDVAHYLLVGGPPQSAMVRKKLQMIWPQARELVVENRQRATVRGCAILAERGFELALSADIAIRQFDDRLHYVLRKGQPFPRGSGELTYREYKYRVTDLAAPQAVLEVGYVPDRGQYEPLEILSVPVVHRRDPDLRSAIPYDVRLRVGLDEYLYVTAMAIGRIQLDGLDNYQETREQVELSRIPLALVPGTSRSTHG
ncbi:MAG: Hsp70 family protein [Planctomycetia bacterium]|nr:Hsp70 family protein [Planctomycetia bacterium]